MIVTNPGNAALCDRWELTFAPAGGDVVFANAAESEPPLVFTNLAGLSTVVVNGRSRTVLGNGAARPGLVKPGSGWPCLIPGDQTVTVTGAATWTLTFKALYL